MTTYKAVTFLWVHTRWDLFCLFVSGLMFFFGFGPPASSIVMGRASKVRAWAEPKPEAWSLSLRLDPPYRWVEPAKPKLEQPFQVSSLSQAQAKPQARPITNLQHTSFSWCATAICDYSSPILIGRKNGLVCNNKSFFLFYLLRLRQLTLIFFI